MTNQYLVAAQQYCAEKTNELKRLFVVLTEIADLAEIVSNKQIHRYVTTLADTYEWMDYLQFAVGELEKADSYESYVESISCKLVADAGNDELKQYARYLINIAMKKIGKGECSKVMPSLLSCIPCAYTADFDLVATFGRTETPFYGKNINFPPEIMKMFVVEGVKYEDGKNVMVWDTPPCMCEDSFIARCNAAMKNITMEQAQAVFRQLDPHLTAKLLEYVDCETKRKILTEYELDNANEIAELMYMRPEKELTTEDLYKMLLEFHCTLRSVKKGI